MLFRFPAFQRLFKRSFLLAIVSILILVGLGSSAKASTIVVGAGGDLQAALNAAQCGDTVVLDATASFTSPMDGLVASKQCSAVTTITVRSSSLPNLPDGVRVSAADAPNMPKIVTPGP